MTARSGSPAVASCSIAVVFSLAFSASAQDWPQWRGPGRDGVAVGARLPEKWPSGELPAVWSVPLGEGYSSPVVVRGKVFTHARQKDDEVVLCLDAETGKEIWRHNYPAPYKMHDAATAHGLGPKATTTVADGRVYAFGISSIMTCLDIGTGKRIWQVNPKSWYEADPAEYGTAGSPLIDGPLVVVPMGGKLGGSVMAFDKKTGQLAWKAVPGELPSSCSPIAADLAGVRHILTFTEKQFVGLDARTGRVLWSYPFETAYRQNIVTPIVVGDLVIASGYDKPAFALRVVKSSQGATANEAWKNRDLRMYMSSPVVVGEHVYGLGSRSQLVCVEAKTGKTAWTGGSFGQYCSIVVAGDRLLVLDDDGNLTLLQADPGGYHELGRSKVSDAPTWSHLALVGSRVYVRDRKRLACLDLLAAANQ